jgi:uncharacterized membrane protein
MDLSGRVANMFPVHGNEKKELVRRVSQDIDKYPGDIQAFSHFLLYQVYASEANERLFLPISH